MLLLHEREIQLMLCKVKRELLLFILLIGFGANAYELPAFPKSYFNYQGNYIVHKVRHNQSVRWQTPEGEKLLKKLRASGYTCLKNRPTTYICHKEKSVESPLPEFAAGVQKLLGKYLIQFPEAYNNVELVHNGASSQEWLVREIYKVNDKELSLMKLVRTDQELWYMVFPVDQDQPLGIFNYISEFKVGFSVLGTVQDPETLGSNHQYFIEAFFLPKR